MDELDVLISSESIMKIYKNQKSNLDILIWILIFIHYINLSGYINLNEYATLT